MSTVIDSEFWTEQDSARFLGLAAITLKIWRSKGKAVAPVYRFGKRVMYRAAEIRAYAEQSRQSAYARSAGKVQP